MKRWIYAALTVFMLCWGLTYAQAAVQEEGTFDSWLSFFKENHPVHQFAGKSNDFDETHAPLWGEANASLFKLPASLQVIEDEAFENTAIVSLDLPKSVVRIGEYAFAHIASFRQIRIHEGTTSIAKTAFFENDRMFITCASNTYAKAWAGENGVPTAPVAVIYGGMDLIRISADAHDKRVRIDLDTARSVTMSPEHPQQIKVFEIKAEQYDDCVSRHIVGRSPPLAAL